MSKKKPTNKTNGLAELTPRQAQILKFLKECDRKGSMPTIRQIGDKFKIASPNGVMCHLRALEKKKYINREADISRGIQLAFGTNSRSVKSDDGTVDLDLTQFSGAAGASVVLVDIGKYKIVDKDGAARAVITLLP